MITIVIPTYNEAGNVKELVSQIRDVKTRHHKYILFVDDDSSDGTGMILDNMAEADDKIKVIHRKDERGLGSAYVRGFNEALDMGSDIIFGMDADLSHDPRDIPKFIKKIKEGYDIVQGSRYVQGGGVDWNWYRVVLSRGANLLATLILGLDLHDVTGAYKAYKREVLERIDLDDINSNGFSFFEEILYRAKLRGFIMGEVPIFFRERQKGKSKLSKMEMFKFFFTMIKLRLTVK